MLHVQLVTLDTPCGTYITPQRKERHQHLQDQDKQSQVFKPRHIMVYHNTTCRRHRQKQSGTGMAKITDLPDELLLDIIQDLATDDILRLRLSCKELMPPSTSAIQRRMRCLYLHPSTSSLRNFRDFCDHPLWASEVSKVTFLGDNDLSLIPGNIPTWSKEKEKQKWSQMFAPLPAVFPQSKARASINRIKQDHSANEATLDIIISSLTKLTALKDIAFETRIREPGFNQVTEAIIKSHGRKHYEQRERRRAGNLEQRLNDFEMLMKVVTSHRLQIQGLAILTVLPFADYSVNLANLTKLELILDHGSIFGEHDGNHEGLQRPAHPETYRWIRCCARLLDTASNIEWLSILLRGTNRSKYALRDYALVHSRICDGIFPKLQHFELARQQDPWWKPAVQRPIVEVIDDDDWKSFLQRHAEMALREVVIDNVLMASDHGRGPIGYIRDVISLPQQLRISCVVNRFEHHRNCKTRPRQPMNMSNCKAGCGIYCLDNTGASISTSDFDTFATERGVELTNGEAWDFGNRVAD